MTNHNRLICEASRKSFEVITQLPQNWKRDSGDIWLSSSSISYFSCGGYSSNYY
jgi:hypothetical protein